MGCSESRISDKNWSDTKNSSENSEGLCEQHQFTLYESIENDDLQNISQILELGFDVNYRMPSFYLRTPLHIACQSGSIKAVELLLKKGANPEIEDSYGISAGFLADLKGKKKCANLLKEVVDKQLMTMRSASSSGSHLVGPYKRKLSVY